MEASALCYGIDHNQIHASLDTCLEFRWEQSKFAAAK